MATRISNAYSPIADSSNLITGYSGATNSGYQKPNYNSFGLIESYSGASPKSASPVIDPNDPLGNQVFNPRTGLNKSGLTKGQQAAKDYQASTGLVKTVKNPEIAAATSNALKQSQDLSGNVIKSFTDYLNEAKTLQEQSRNQVNADTDALAAAPAKLESGLSKTVQDFAAQANALTNRVTALNDANATTVNSNIAALGGLNADYEANARAVADRAVAAGLARNNAYQSATGTPRSGSGYQNQLAARTTSDILLPVEAELSRNRINQLTNYITPQQQQLYANKLSQITGLELPIANTLVQLGISNASQLAQFTASLAGRSLQEQITYLGTLGIPIQMAQQLAASLPQAIGSLASIDQANNFYTLAQDYQSPLGAPLPTYSLPTPTAPQPARPGYSPYPTVNNVRSDYGLPTQVAPAGTAGPAVGVNGSGQLIDARGNIVGYPSPGSYRPSYPNVGMGDYANEVNGPDYTAGAYAGGQFFPTTPAPVSRDPAYYPWDASLN